MQTPYNLKSPFLCWSYTFFTFILQQHVLLCCYVGEYIYIVADRFKQDQSQTLDPYYACCTDRNRRIYMDNTIIVINCTHNIYYISTHEDQNVEHTASKHIMTSAFSMFTCLFWKLCVPSANVYQRVEQNIKRKYILKSLNKS